jgi:hypothetical protein
MQILNFDETVLTLDGSGTAAGGRPQAIFYNPHLPLVSKATSKEGATSTMITGSSAAGEAIPPHFQFMTMAQHEDNKQCQTEAAASFPKIRGKFGMDEPRYLGVSVGLNEKGGMDEAEFEKYIRNSILPLFPDTYNMPEKQMDKAEFEKYIRNSILPLFLDACDMPGKHIMIKVNSSPG